MMPVHILAHVIVPRRLYFYLPLFFHRVLLCIIGMKVVVYGDISNKSPTLFVSNHSSYLDIPVLGSLIPGGFVSKSEVARWPMFGLMAKLQRSVFIERKSRLAGTHKNDIRDRLDKGESLIVFPEGTSSDGNRVLPFKSSLFSVIGDPLPDGSPLTVQPVTVTFSALDDMPVGSHLRPLYAWYGDMTLVDHLWRYFKLGVVTVVVQFHRPIVAEGDMHDRKALAKACHDVVAAGMSKAVSGRIETTV